MKTSSNFKSNFIYIVALLHILLFTYAAASKIMDFQNFQAQLGQSPLLSPYAEFVSFAVPIIELVLVLLLGVPNSRLLGLYLSCWLMVLFTTYILIILNFSSFVPCSCGGILEKLGWTEHLLFNIAFIVLALFAILLHQPSKKTLLKLGIGSVLSAAFLVILFLNSENIMHHENPFIRRFPQGTAAKVAGIDLANTAFYIAGATTEKVYLANREAPLQLFEFDTALQHRKQHTIRLDSENFSFRSVRIKVQPPYFYVYDGSVPVLFKGLVSNWQASVVSEKEFGFDDIQFIGDEQVLIRGQKPKQSGNILATVDFKDSLKFNINETLLQKQSDGIFDTDGTLQYSFELHKLVYTYYYRNEYIVADANLKLQFRGNTIDTTSKARIKVVTLKKSGDSKMAAPPYIVNKLSTVTNNLLFVNSMLRGKYESETLWKSATAVDVYDITNKTYLLSFYVYHEKGFPMKNFYATSDALYILSGHYLLKYGFGPRIQSKFHN